MEQTAVSFEQVSGWGDFFDFAAITRQEGRGYDPVAYGER
jgi:hypothetical protein